MHAIFSVKHVCKRDSMFILLFMRSWLHNWNILKIDFRFDFDFDFPMEQVEEFNYFDLTLDEFMT